MHQPMPGLPEFDYVRASSLEEASRILADHVGEARPFMGGTDTFVRMRDRVWHERILVDVKGLPGMKTIAFDPQEGLRLGAAVNMNEVIRNRAISAHYPLLAEAARAVASYQLRSRATVAGNVCNASPAGDTIGACMVLDGVLLVHGPLGMREVPLDSFFLGPGRSVLGPGDVVTTLRFPVPPSGSAGRYLKLGRNAVGDLAIVGVTAFGYPDAQQNSGYRFRLVLASVAPTALVAQEAEAILANKPLTPESVEEAAEAAQAAARPISDARGSAHYRKLMVRNLTRRAVLEVWAQLKE